MNEDVDPNAPGAQEPIDVTPPAPGTGDRVIKGKTKDGTDYTVTVHDRQKGVRGDS